MNKSMQRREETSLLCQQEYAEGWAAGELLLEEYLGRKCCEVGEAGLRDHAERRKRRKLKS